MKTDSEYGIIAVLNSRHQIPHHSRKFTWDREHHVETVVKALISDWLAKAIHWLGFLIIYNNGIRLPAISDGQHRVTICYFVILALADLLKNDQALEWISKYGTNSIICDTVTEADQAIMNEHGWTRFPNIHSVYEEDFIAIGNLLNRVESEKDSKIYAAYEAVHDILSKTLTGPTEFKSLLQFIHNDVKMTRMVITDWGFALKTFNALNNIRVSVDSSYLLKNIFTQAIGENRADEVHTAFTKWEHEEEDYERFIFMAFNMYRKHLTFKDEFDAYLATNPVLPPTAFADFQACVAKCQEYIRQMKADRFGKILFKKGFISGHEVIECCLLPLAVASDGIPVRLLRTLVAYGVRLPINKKVSFNGLSFQTPIRALIAKVFAGLSSQQACVEITTLLADRVKDSITTRLSVDTFEKTHFGRARSCLLYLAEVTDSHEATLDHDRIHIDHIYAKTRGAAEPLANVENTHRLGNFTPLCGANSETLKGNSSLSNKVYAEKIASYKSSNIAMTRDVAEYSTFADTEIEARSLALAKKLDELTWADLNR